MIKSELRETLQLKTKPVVNDVIREERNTGVVSKIFGASRKSFLKIRNKTFVFSCADRIKFELCPIIKIEELEDIKKEALVDTSVALQKLDKAYSMEQPKTKKQNTLLSLIFLIINIALVVFIAKSFFDSTGGLDFGAILSNQGNKLWWLAGAGAMLVFMVFAESLLFCVLIKHTTGKFRPFLAYKTAITGKYYESLTPLAVGAQPSQIVYMTKRGVSAGVATGIPIIKLIVYNTLFAITALLFFVFGMPTLSVASELDGLLQTLMKIVAFIGLFVSVVIVLGVVIIATSKKFGKKLSKGVIKLGVSFRIVKNCRKSYDKLMNSVLEFQSSMNYLKKNKTMFVLSVLSCLLEILSYISIAFFATMAFGETAVSSSEYLALWFECSVRFLMCFMAASFIPLPGGTGMMEVGFICLFGTSKFMGSNNIFWGFLTFRFLTYYQWIVQGLVLIVCDIIAGIVKNRKLGKKVV